MKLYADVPARLLRQLLGDLFVLVTGWLCVQLGRATHDRVSALADPGRDAERTALALDGRLRGAARDVSDAPLVGGALARPFRDLAATSRELAGQAQAYQDTVAQVATLAGVVVAAVPVLLVLSVWLPRRVAWVVEASAAVRLVRRGAPAYELLAVRALARQSLPRLARVPTSVISGWKVGDPGAAEALARLELEELGLRTQP